METHKCQYNYRGRLLHGKHPAGVANATASLMPGTHVYLSFGHENVATYRVLPNHNRRASFKRNGSLSSRLHILEWTAPHCFMQLSRSSSSRPIHDRNGLYHTHTQTDNIMKGSCLLRKSKGDNKALLASREMTAPDRWGGNVATFTYMCDYKWLPEGL